MQNIMPQQPGSGRGGGKDRAARKRGASWFAAKQQQSFYPLGAEWQTCEVLAL